MLVHTVYFWLNEGNSDGAVREFEDGLEELLEITSVRSGYWGKPAGTPREVVDNSYSYGLTVIFDDQAGYDAYQVDPIHKNFVELNSGKWDRVQVYDYVR